MSKDIKKDIHHVCEKCGNIKFNVIENFLAMSTKIECVHCKQKYYKIIENTDSLTLENSTSVGE